MRDVRRIQSYLNMDLSQFHFNEISFANRCKKTFHVGITIYIMSAIISLLHHAKNAIIKGLSDNIENVLLHSNLIEKFWMEKIKNGWVYVTDKQIVRKNTETFSYDESLLSSVAEQIVVYHEYARR